MNHEIDKSLLLKHIQKSDLLGREKMYLEELVHRTAWIPCSERLPADGQRVLICTGMQKIFVAAYDRSAAMFRQRVRQVMHAWYGEEVTHWMPLPEPPEIKEDNND